MTDITTARIRESKSLIFGLILAFGAGFAVKSVDNPSVKAVTEITTHVLRDELDARLCASTWRGRALSDVALVDERCATLLASGDSYGDKNQK